MLDRYCGVSCALYAMRSFIEIILIWKQNIGLLNEQFSYVYIYLMLKNRHHNCFASITGEIPYYISWSCVFKSNHRVLTF